MHVDREYSRTICMWIENALTNSLHVDRESLHVDRECSHALSLQVEAINGTVDVFPNWFLADVAKMGYIAVLLSLL